MKNMQNRWQSVYIYTIVEGAVLYVSNSALA